MKALDIDGIVCPFTEEVWVPAMNEILGTNHTISDVEQHYWGYQEVFNITKEEEKTIWISDNIVERMKVAKPIQKGIELVQSYETEGVDYVWITSRAAHNLNARAFRIRAVTKNWIKNVVGSEKEIFFVPGHRKHLKAKELDVSTMYEDKPETVEMLAKTGIQVFMPKYIYNQHVEATDFITPVENWIENE